MARIFFIEDNEGLREAATGYLKLDDHEVVEFGRLQGVLEALRVREPDLIILDVMLPDGNGFQLARSIRRDYNIPIIFLTAKTSESDRITGFEVGGDDYVLKPFSARELNLRVKAVLKRTGKEIAESRVSERLVFKESELVMDSKAHLALLEIDKDETNKVVISLFNSGAPIPEEEINRVFDRLFRGEYARNTPGSGLGLTIARKITELHGGTIAIRSRNDYGTTVVLTM